MERGGDEGTYVDDGGGPQLGPGVIVRQVLEIVARALNEGTHGISEPLGALRVLREELVDGLVRVIRQCESLHTRILNNHDPTQKWNVVTYRLIRFLRLRILDHGIDGLRRSLPQLIGAGAHPVEDLLVLGQQSRRGGVHDHALARLTEDVLRHGVPEEAAHVGLVQAARFGDLSKGRFGVYGKAGCYLEAADSLHADQFVMLVGTALNCLIEKGGAL